MAEYHNATPRGWVPDHPAGQGATVNNRTPDTGKVNQFAADMWEVFDSAGNLLLSKHKDYGPTNISKSPGGPLNGLRVRMWDKTARLNHLIDSGATPENESLRDSFIDLLNYSAIALMVLDGKWPND
jgi:hypothetical protein